MPKPKRIREKPCDVCQEISSVRYRIRVTQDWLFACPTCRKKLELANPHSYQYGGTWKAKKRH